jgi:hypothetical protein
MSQSSEILDHLKRHKNISPLEAFREYGCFRLAARINDLRKDGHNIKTLMTSEPDGKSFAVYIWEEQ